MTPESALQAIAAHGDAERAAGAKAYHKSARTFLGVPNPILNHLTKDWRRTLTLEDRLLIADGLWNLDIHETRVAASKLLTQARIRPDDNGAWELIKTWVPDFDGWAIADHASIAGQKRLVAKPERIDEIASWTTSPHLWTKRAVLFLTLPWTKQNHPKPDEVAVRERVLGWAAAYVEDEEWFIQKAVAWWLRELSKHDDARARAFLQTHGPKMKSFARKEAAKYLL